jgi:hypothetical protein
MAKWVLSLYRVLADNMLSDNEGFRIKGTIFDDEDAD